MKQINSKNLKSGLIALGALSIIATGIVAYFVKEKSYLTWEEYLATIETYNVKMEEIRDDCKNDTRCEDGKVIFRNIRTKKDILDRLNQWIGEDEENPNTYKLTPK